MSRSPAGQRPNSCCHTSEIPIAIAQFLPLLALVFRRLFEFPGRNISCVPGIYLYANWRHIVTFWLWVICALWTVSIANQLTIRCDLPPGVAPINQWGLSDQINPTVGG